MSFKSEAAKVKSNIAAGAYKEKTNVWGGFFDELAYGIKKQDEEERQERLEARREARANGRRIKAKQDAQDKQDKQDTALTNLYLTMNDIYPTPQNISSVLSVVRGGARSITDLTTVMDKTSTVKRAVPPAPAPSVPTPRTNASGTMLTSQTSTATGSSLEDEMPMTRKVDEEKRDAEVLETLTNNSGIEPDMIQFGVQPDDVKDMDIDAVRFALSDTTISDERRALLKRRLDSLTDPNTYKNYTLYRPDGTSVVARSAKEEAELRGQGFGAEKPVTKDYKKNTLYHPDGRKVEVLSLEMQAKFEAQGFASVEPAKPADWMTKAVTKTNIASYTASVDAALKGLPEDDPNRMRLTERKLHIQSVAAIQEQAAKRNIDFDLTDNYVTLTLKPDDTGVSRDIRVQLTEQGKFFDITTGDFIDRDTVKTVGPSSKQVNTAVNLTNKFNQHFGNKLSQVKEDTVTLLKTAKQLDDLVLNNPAILTFVGGQATAFLTGLETEIQTLSYAIGSQQLSSSQVEAALMAKGQKYAESQASKYGMASNADSFYKWTALNLRHAFSFAKLDLDSAGMALSNMDFKNALTINNVGKTYATYSGNLKTQTNSVVEKALQRHSLLLGDPEYKLALKLPLVAQAFKDNPTIMPLKEYLQENAQEQYTWATSQESNPPTSDDTEKVSGGGGPTTLPDFNTFLNSPEDLKSRFELWEKVVTNGDATDLETFYQRTAKRFYGPTFTQDNLDFVKESLLDSFSRMGGN